MSVPSARATRTPSITVEQAEAFCAAAAAGSYRGAAAVLGWERHVAVIRLVGRFTEALGRGQLLVADQTGHVTITPTGREVLPVARQFAESAHALRQPQFGVRFSAYPSITAQLLARCGELLTANPPLLLSDVSEASRRSGGRGLVEDLVAHVHDLVIAPAGAPIPGVVEEPLYRWTLRVLLPDSADASLRGRSTLRPEHLRGFAVAAAPPGHNSRALLDALCSEEGVQLRVDLASTSQEVLRDLVRASSQHAAILPDDAFGAPDEHLGPALTDARGRRRGGRYALYRRASGARPTRHEREVLTIAERIVSAMRDR